MDQVGNANLWDDKFPHQMIPDILELVVDCWGRFKKPGRNEYENTITRHFREELVIEKNERRLPFTIWRESSESADPKTGNETGRIDLRFQHGWRETVYFAFECKRLRYTYKGKKYSNTDQYVGKEGMMCFISGKYSAEVDSGGMIGYVMDGNIQNAIQSIKNSIDKKYKELCLKKETSLERSSLSTSNNIKETNHDLVGRTFTIHHVFLGAEIFGYD